MTRRMMSAGVATLLLAALALAGPVRGATPDVGSHLHLAVTNMPADGHPIAKAPYTFHQILQTHSQIGKTAYERIDDSSTTRAKTTIVLGPADSLLATDWTVDFSGWSTGRHELRFHLDVPSNSDGKRQFTTSRVQVCVGSCSPNIGGRPTPFLGGGSWYTTVTYVVPVLDSPLSSVTPGGTITVHSQYSRSTSICVFANPNFHAGSSGTTLGCFGGGTGKHSVSLAGLAVGDNLVIVSLTAQEAGVLHVKVTDGSDAATYYFETQSWWSKTGLVLP